MSVLRLTRSVDVARRQDEVFDFVADVRNHMAWHRELAAVELVGDGPVGPGSEFRAVFRRFGPVEIRIAEYQRPWRLTFRVTGSTNLTYEFDFRRPGRGHENRDHCRAAASRPCPAAGAALAAARAPRLPQARRGAARGAGTPTAARSVDSGGWRRSSAPSTCSGATRRS